MRTGMLAGGALLPLVGTLLVATTAAAGPAIRLQVDETLGQARHETLTSGVPLPKGVLQDPGQARLVDSTGQALPFRATCLSRWPDGSVKWLLLHCAVTLPANASRAWSLVPGQAPTTPTEQVTVGDAPDAVTVNTGPLQFRVGRAGFRFLDQVWLDANRDGRFDDSEALLRPGAGGSWMEFEHTSPHPPQEENWLWDATGGPRGRFTAAPDATDYTVTVEESGPARAVVLVRGAYRSDAGRRIAPFWVRYTANAGEARIGVEHFFAFDGDPKADFLRTLVLRLPLRAAAPLAATFGTEGTAGFALPADVAQASLYEVVPDRFYTGIPYTTDRTVPYVIEGTSDLRSADSASRTLATGKAAAGWLSVKGGTLSLTIAGRDFWQLHPKELRVTPATGDLDLYLWPEKGNKVLDLRRRYEGADTPGHYDLNWYPEQGRGVGKTHEFALDFSGAPPLRVWAAVQEPLRAFCLPQHYADTGLWGPFAPCDPQRFPRWEARMDVGMEWLLRLPSVFHWDGMLDWGDTLFNGYEVAGHNQMKDVPKGSWVLRGYDGWINNDTSFAGGILLQFLRTGDLRVWHRFERLTQHVMDVDTVHCAANPRVIGGGHRHDEQHWGNIVTGYGIAAAEAADLYFLTGRHGALEMAAKYADWYLDGDWCEWENRIGCLTRGWEATGDERYLRALAPEALEKDTYIRTLHQPFFRSHATIADLAHYAAVMPTDWGQAVLKRAVRRLIDESMGNGCGLNLLAIVCTWDKDPELRDWLRRFLASHDCYTTPVVDAFDYTKLMPGRAADVDFEALQQLVKHPGFSVQNTFGFVQGVLYQYPYVIRALTDGGLTEKDRYLSDSVYKKRGWGWEWGLRGAPVPPLVDCRFVPLSLAAVANRNPLADPLSETDRPPTASALKPGQIGFQFEEAGPPLCGYLPVRGATLFPRTAHRPDPAEHDDRNFTGLPFGATFTANGIPFDLPEPRRAPGGRTILVLDQNQQATIPVGLTARRLHFFGHVSRWLTTVKEVGARYRLRYADGTETVTDLVNMEHFEHILYWGFSKQARFARNWKLHGGWDGEPFLVNTFTLAVEARPLNEIVVEDTGKGYGFVLLAVTAEVAGADAATPVKTIGFGGSEAGAAKNLWQDGADAGWADADLPLEQGAAQVTSHGRATWRLRVPDGTYELELRLSGWGASLGVNLLVNGQLRVQAYCPTHQAAPGSPDFAETLRLPVQVTSGVLDVTLANDAGAGTWWHPAPIANSRWALWRLSLYPGKALPPPPLPGFTYGWRERDIEWLRHPWNIHTEATDELARTCLRSRSPRGTFLAQVPAGRYEAELVLGFKGEAQQDQTPKMNVTLQGTRVLSDFVSPPARQVQRQTYAVTVAPGSPLELILEPVGDGAEWGLNALILRPAP